MPNKPSTWLNDFATWAMRAAIAAILTLLVKMNDGQNELLRKIALQDMRVTQLEKEVATLRGNMVTVDTLKRVEIYMELIMQKAGIQQKIDLTQPQR